MRHVTYHELADELIYGSWGKEYENRQEFARIGGHETWKVALLIDIAKSLRVLRCRDFQDIPRFLELIRENTKKPRKKKK